MKKLLIAVLLLSACAYGSGWDSYTNQTGLGLGTFDSLYCVGTARIGSTLTVTGTSALGKVTSSDSLFVNTVVPNSGKVLTLGGVVGDTLKWNQLVGTVRDEIRFTTSTEDGGANRPKITFWDSTSGSARDYADIYLAKGASGTGLAMSRAMLYVSWNGSAGMQIQGNRGINITGDTCAIAGGQTCGYSALLGYWASGSATKGTTADSTGLYVNYTGGRVQVDTVKAVKGVSVGGGTMLTGIYTGNATFGVELTSDTNLVSGVTAASRISVLFRSTTANLTKPITARTVAETLFVNCAAADTAAVRAGSVDYIIFK